MKIDSKRKLGKLDKASVGMLAQKVYRATVSR
jgi:hypothetical protein